MKLLSRKQWAVVFVILALLTVLAYRSKAPKADELLSPRKSERSIKSHEKSEVAAKSSSVAMLLKSARHLQNLGEAVDGTDFAQFRRDLENSSADAIIELIRSLSESEESFALRIASIAFSELARKDSYRCMELLGDSTVNKSLLKGAPQIVGIAVKNDPNGMKRWLQDAIKHQPDCIPVWRLAMGAYARHDLDGALKLLSESSGKARSEALSSVGASMGAISNDPSRDATRLESLFSGEELASVQKSYFDGLAVNNPEKFFQFVKSGSVQASLSIPLAYYRLIGQDPALAGNQLKSFDPEITARIFSLQENITRLYKTNPQEVLDAISRLPLSTANLPTINKMADLLANKDINMALDWISKLPESPAKNTISVNLYSKWASGAPLEMGELIGKLDGDQREIALVGIAQGLGAHDLDVVSSVADGLGPDERSKFLTKAIDVAARSGNVIKAADLLSAKVRGVQSGDLQQYQDSVGQVAQIYGLANLNESQVWMEGLPDSLKGAALVGITKSFISKDVVKASQWIATLPDSDARDQSISLLIRELDHVDSKASAQWRDYLDRSKK